MNRETSVLLVIAHGLAAWHCNRRDLRDTAGLFALWVIVTALVHASIGDGVRYWTLARIVELNLETWPEAAAKTLVFGGVWAWLAWRGYRQAHPFARALAWLLPIYAALFIVGAHYFETRLLLLALPLLLALAAERIANHARLQAPLDQRRF